MYISPVSMNNITKYYFGLNITPVLFFILFSLVTNDSQTPKQKLFTFNTYFAKKIEKYRNVLVISYLRKTDVLP